MVRATVAECIARSHTGVRCQLPRGHHGEHRATVHVRWSRQWEIPAVIPEAATDAGPALPCPFCGSPPTFDPDHCEVSCSACQAYAWGESEAEALATWNRRVPRGDQTG